MIDYRKEPVGARNLVTVPFESFHSDPLHGLLSMGMVDLRSAVAGVAAQLIIAFVIDIADIAARLAIAVGRSGDRVIWHLHTESGVFWLLAIVTIAFGFFWKFKRLSK